MKIVTILLLTVLPLSFSINASCYSLPIYDINPILNIFPDCFLHLTTYEAFVTFGNKPNEALVRLEDFVPFKHPIVLSNYVVIGNRLDYTEGDPNLNLKFEGLSVIENETSIYKFSPVAPLQLCAVQLYFNYDLTTSSIEYGYGKPTNCTIGCDFVHSSHQDILFPKMKCILKDRLTEMCPYQLSESSSMEHNGVSMFHTLEKFGVYQILLLRNEQRQSKAVLKWGASIGNVYSLYGDIRPSAVSNIFVELVIILHSGQSDWSADVHYVMFGREYQNYKLRKLNIRWENTEESRNFIKNLEWQRDSKYGVQRYWQLIDLNFPMRDFIDLHHQMNKHFSDNRYPVFRNYETWMSSNIMIFYAMHANKSDWKATEMNYTISPLCNGEIYFEHHDSYHMVSIEEGLAFITCGGTQIGQLSLVGYMSAFDNWIWLWNCIAITVTILMLYFKHNWLDYGSTELLDEIMMPIDISLEQGNQLAENKAGGSGRYFVFGAWVAAALVLSNAYKGQNITDLTHPIPPVKPESFQDLIRQNFSIESKSDGVAYMETTCLIVDLVQRFLSNSSSPYLMKDNLLTTLIDYAEDDKVTQNYRNIEKLIRNLNLDEWKEAAEVGNKYFVNRVKFCNNTAFMSWSSDIEEANHLLKSLLRRDRNFTESHVNRLVSTSRESLIPTRKGGTLKDVTVPIKAFMFKLSAVHESGIAKQWKHWGKWLKTIRYMLDFERLNFDPVKLTMNDNIIVVFYVHGSLLSMCIFIFALELLAPFIIIYIFVSFSFKFTAWNKGII